MTILDYTDDVTRSVIELIVNQYQNDIAQYTNNSCSQVCRIGIDINSILKDCCNCVLKQLKSENGFVLMMQKDCPNLPTVKEQTYYRFNNSLIERTRALQIINFLKRLSDEGLILFTDTTDYKGFPKFEGMATEESGTIACLVDNKRLDNFIKAVYYSHIIPTESLTGYMRDGYKTKDQIRFEEQKRISKKSLQEAKIANQISQNSLDTANKSIESSTRDNRISVGVAILVALFTMSITIFIGNKPTSLTETTIHEIGREIHLNSSKDFVPYLNINNYPVKIDTIKYERTSNAKP
ncbi:MAG: hypothetical protein K2H60_04930 [Muribaculaceae bacterium]|nr:hypothetical protein [Muribaculaceae bacterium]